MESKKENPIKEKLNYLLTEKQIEKLEQITIFNRKLTDYLTRRNAINMIIAFFVYIFIYFAFIKEDSSDLLNTIEKKILEEKNFFFTDIKPS